MMCFQVLVDVAALRSKAFTHIFCLADVKNYCFWRFSVGSEAHCQAFSADQRTQPSPGADIVPVAEGAIRVVGNSLPLQYRPRVNPVLDWNSVVVTRRIAAVMNVHIQIAVRASQDQFRGKIAAACHRVWCCRAGKNDWLAGQVIGVIAYRPSANGVWGLWFAFENTVVTCQPNKVLADTGAVFWRLGHRGGAKSAGRNQEKSFHRKSLRVGKFLADHIRAALGVSSGRGAFKHQGWGAVVPTGHHTVRGMVARLMCPPSSLLDLGAWLRLRARPFSSGVVA